MNRWMVLGLAVLTSSVSASSPSLSIDQAIRNPSCGFSKSPDHTSPAELMAEFIKKDSEGEFMMMSPWFDTATLCPHREVIPDHAFVIKTSQAAQISANAEIVDFEVTYQLLGALNPLGGADAGRKGFTPLASQKKRKFVAVKTPAGWRLINPVLGDGQFVNAQAVLRDGRIRSDDRKLLERLAAAN